VSNSCLTCEKGCYSIHPLGQKCECEVQEGEIGFLIDKKFEEFHGIIEEEKNNTGLVIALSCIFAALIVVVIILVIFIIRRRNRKRDQTY